MHQALGGRNIEMPPYAARHMSACLCTHQQLPHCTHPADLQRHLRDVHVEKVLRKRTCARCTSSNGTHSHAHPTDTLQSALSMPEEAFPCETPVSHTSPSAGGAADHRMPFGRATASATASPCTTRLSDQGMYTARGAPAGAVDDRKLQSDVSSLKAPAGVSACLTSHISCIRWRCCCDSKPMVQACRAVCGHNFRASVDPSGCTLCVLPWHWSVC